MCSQRALSGFTSRQGPSGQKPSSRPTETAPAATEPLLPPLLSLESLLRRYSLKAQQDVRHLREHLWDNPAFLALETAIHRMDYDEALRQLHALTLQLDSPTGTL